MSGATTVVKALAQARRVLATLVSSADAGQTFADGAPVSAAWTALQVAYDTLIRNGIPKHSRWDRANVSDNHILRSISDDTVYIPHAKLALETRVDILSSMAESQRRTVKRANGRGARPVVVFVALNEERRAFEALLTSTKTVHGAPTDPYVYTEGRIKGTRVVIISPGRMGRASAASTTAEAIRSFKPQLVVVIGIAGGFKDRDVALGDIIVADQIIDYELQKVGPRKIRYRWAAYPCDRAVDQIAQRLDVSDFAARIPVKRPRRGQSLIHFGGVLSGDKVVANGKILKVPKAVWGKAIGVEMEALGVAIACHDSSTRVAMVRAVSDFADSRKSTKFTKTWRKYSCAAAAAFAHAIIARMRR